MVAGALTLAAAAACSDATTSTPTPAVLSTSGGNNQIVTIGGQPAALQVRVTAGDSTPITNATVLFQVISGSGTVSPTSAITSASGYATTQLTVGSSAGTVVVSATVQGTALTTTFTITAVASTTTDCVAGSAPPVGAVLSVTGSTLCATAGSSSAEYALIPFYGSAVASARASFQVTATGVVAPSSSLDVEVAGSGAASLSRLATGMTRATTTRGAAEAFELRLRKSERRLITPRLAGARAWLRSGTAAGGARRNAIPATATVGQLLTLNANADSDCTAPVYRVGRVAAVTNKAIVVADTGNPRGGYSDAEYASLGTSFDTLIDPMDTRYFGQPSDIDHNGKIVLFFTRAVNDLTPATSQSYIGGFFYARDLFPVTATSSLDACASSNVGEMFYMMVPDSVRGGAFNKASVSQEVLGTVAHEYQHLINASRRMYVNTAATDFEEVWLNEGLSHVAEELLFYQLSGLSPRQNIGTTTLRQTQKRVDMFNAYGIDNFGRYYEYLSAPSSFGPYSDNDSLATRGATWAFLRYAADRRATTDGDLWYQLVNSTTTGVANLRNVFGADVISQIRDWSTSVLGDDVAGFGVAYQQPSWDFRSIFSVLVPGAFPLSTVSLGSSARTVTLVAGASAYLRFAVPANSSASVQWTAVPLGMQLSLVRTK